MPSRTLLTLWFFVGFALISGTARAQASGQVEMPAKPSSAAKDQKPVLPARDDSKEAFVVERYYTRMSAECPKIIAHIHVLKSLPDLKATKTAPHTRRGFAFLTGGGRAKRQT
jgi:hypothetical protein